jgi:hypothetical protein
VSGTPGGSTWSCGHVREQLGAYVVNGLEREEAAVVSDHLAVCPDCAAERDALAGLPALLDHAAGLELEPLRPGLEERVLDAVARERGRPRRPHRARRLLPARARVAVVATVAGAALGAAVTALAVGGNEEGPAPAGAPLRYGVVLTGAWGAKGKAALVPKKNGTEVHLVVDNLPVNRDIVYEVRCIAGDWSASAGTFRTDRRGRAYAVLTTAARPGEYELIKVERKMNGRSKEVMTGKI